MVEIETASLERSVEKGKTVWSAPTTVQNLQVGRHGCWGSFQIHWKCKTVCRNLSMTTRVGCTLLKTGEAGSSLRNVERALKRWSRVWIFGDVVFSEKRLNVKVSSWNVSGDLFLSQTSMLKTWMLKSGVIGTHELFMAETLCCQALHSNNGMTAGQKLLESEQMECRGAGLVQATSMAPMASMASMAPMASMATMFPEAVTVLLVPKLNIRIPQPRLQLAATPRQTYGSRSLRRVDRIGGMRAESSCKIDGEPADRLFYKIGEQTS